MLDTTTGRWMQPDPKGFAAGDGNLRRDVSNDPANRVDPTGLDGGPPPIDIHARAVNDSGGVGAVGPGLRPLGPMPTGPVTVETWSEWWQFKHDLQNTPQILGAVGQWLYSQTVFGAYDAGGAMVREYREYKSHAFSTEDALGYTFINHMPFISTLDVGVGEMIVGKSEKPWDGGRDLTAWDYVERGTAAAQDLATLGAMGAGAFDSGPGTEGAGLSESTPSSEQTVFRGLAEDENPANGLSARAPGAGNSVVSHIAGKEESQWISTTREEGIARGRFGANGVVEIDLSKVTTDIVDVSNGIPGMEGTMLSNWAAKMREVLVKDFIPPEAIKPLP